MMRPRDEEFLKPQDLAISSLLQGVRDAVIVAEASTGRIVYWNPAASEVFGYSPAEALGMNVEELVPGLLGARQWAEISRYRETGHGRYIESPAVPKGGEEIGVELTLSLLELVRDAGVQGKFVLTIVRDDTERKRAEETSRESHALLHSIIEGTAEAIFLKDSQGRYVIVNSACVEIVGKPAEMILGKTDADLYPPEVADSLVEVDRRVMDTGETITLEESLPVAGAMRTYLSTKTPYRDHRGNVGGIIGVSTDITERKEVERELREAERRYRTLVEQIPAITYIQELGEPSRTTYISPQYETVLGYSSQECLSDPEHWIKIMHPADKERVLAEDRRTNETGEPFRMEYRQLAKDGRVVWIRDEATLVRDEEETPSYWLGVQTDITEHKRAEERLQEAEARYRSLVEEVPAVIYIQEIDHEGSISYISPQIEDIMGYSPQEYMDDPNLWVRTIHPEDRERVLAEEQRTDETGEPFRVEFRKVKRDGRVTWVRDEAVLVKTPEGTPLYWQGIFVDVTERKRTEHALKASEERFRQLFEQSVDALFVHDENGRFFDCNSQACRLLGYSRQELLSLSVRDVSCNLLTEEERALREKEGGTLWQRALAGTPGTFALGHEEDHRRKDGTTFPVEVRVGSVDYGGRRMLLASVRDITERKRAEEALQESHGRIGSILESITEDFFAVDREWRYTYINERALGHIQSAQGEQLTREGILGKNVWEMFPEIVGSVFYQKYHEALREQKTTHFEAYAQLIDTWFEVNVYPSEEGLAVYSRDITDRKRTEKEIETRTHQQAVVAELGRQALAETDLQALMNEAVSLVAQTLDVEYCKIVEVLPEGDELLLRAGVGWDEGLVGRATEETGLGSQAGFTLLSEEPVILEDLREEERFSASTLLRDHGVVSGMSVIILAPDQPFGILGAHTKSRRTFTGDDINFLQAVANVLATAIERVKVEETLGEVREAERDRLARDLHDEALQDLTWALAETQLLQRNSEDPELEHRLERIGEALKRAGQGMHAAIYDLYLESQGREQTLVEMLGSLVELTREGSPDCEIVLSVEDDFSSILSATAQVELLRILREALTNALRHSEADHVRIAVGNSEGGLWAEVEDDGRGFDPVEEPSAITAGIGTGGMRERARALGGVLKIESEPGKGTKVRFELAHERYREEPEEETRILLVDDHISVRQAMASVFEREPGFIVVGQAGSLSEARQMLEAEQVDVAVVDLRLPDGYGGELIKDLRTHSPGAQALVLSAILKRADIARAVESGAAGALHKSAGLDEVVAAVKRLRAGETLLSLEEVVELIRFAGSRREEEFEARQAIARLTPREKELLQALADGLDSNEIAGRLHISVKTEANHLTSILNKLGVHSRLQALVFAVRHCVVEIR